MNDMHVINIILDQEKFAGKYPEIYHMMYVAKIFDLWHLNYRIITGFLSAFCGHYLSFITVCIVVKMSIILLLISFIAFVFGNMSDRG